VALVGTGVPSWQETRVIQREKENTMTTARDVMQPGVECVGENDTLIAAARKMRDLDVGSLPICGEDGKLKGMLTDRDIVVRCLAEGGDPNSATAGSLAQGKPVTIGADDDIETALETMKKHKVRRLPVIDGHEMVGIISQGDLATYLPEASTGDLVGEISEPS
jgi:CBS domain-containing protein